MYKIFINNIPVYLTVHQTTNFPNQDRHNLQVTYQNRQELLDVIQHVNKSHSIQKVHILGDSLAKVKEDFFGCHRLIEAAGGIVFNHLDEILLIYRNGRWDLPKGKIELGEGVEEAAIREVQEETGLDKISISSPVVFENIMGNATYHTYFDKRGNRILKRTYWFIMVCDGKPDGTPQLEEGITKVAWIPRTELNKHVKTSYGSIQDVVDAAMKASV